MRICAKFYMNMPARLNILMEDIIPLVEIALLQLSRLTGDIKTVFRLLLFAKFYEILWPSSSRAMSICKCFIPSTSFDI